MFKRSNSPFDASDVMTVIGAEAYFHGTMTVRGSIRVEGKVEGDILEAQGVVIGSTGRVRGNVCADSVVVGGHVYGDIIAAAALEIKAGGRVAGNIRAPKLFIEDGASFEGSCSMSEKGAPAAVEPEPIEAA